MKVMVGDIRSLRRPQELLARSFELAGPDGEVIIGLTTDEFAGAKVHPVRSYQERLKNVASFIEKHGYTAEWKVEPLSDRYGSSLDADFDILVVSEETFPVALEINELRRQRGRRRVDLHEISCVSLKMVEGSQAPGSTEVRSIGMGAGSDDVVRYIVPLDQPVAVEAV